MERPRSFKSLAPRTTGSGKPPMPTTATTSAVPTAVPAPAEPTTAPASATPITAPASARPTTAPAYAKPTSVPPFEPRDTSSAKKTITTAKGNIFQDKASPSSVFSTLVFHNDVVTPINTESSGDMMRQGLKFLVLVNKMGHELEADVEGLKRKVEDETRRTENARTTADGLRVERHAAWASIDKKNKELMDKAKEIVSLKAEARKSAAAFLAEAEKSAIAFTAAEEREQYSAAIMTKRDGELAKVVDRLRQADEQIRSLERKFARAKGKFDELQGDPRSNIVYQVHRVANLDFVRLLMGLLDGHEPPKLDDELTFLTADVAEHARDEERFEQLMKNLHGLLHVLDPKVKVPAVVTHDRTLETFTASVGVAEPSGSLLGGAGSRKAAVAGVDGKFSLTGGVGAKVTKSRIEDVAEGAGTVGAPEEMRTDEDSQGPRTSLERQRPRGCRLSRLLLQELTRRPFLSCVLRIC
ncbi:hypothetical protein AALP_AA6G165200 [Arabis alpina]|uniref:Uncharacterized protein n=1 Tax=Arabis alpina TaxID=50452 RepID=A0A087GPN8_ARAAL|nr:hypothetical protein AALP_AA6G165200 [Arabis alpina]